jgi:molybdate transport system substrate-binding protein
MENAGLRRLTWLVALAACCAALLTACDRQTGRAGGSSTQPAPAREVRIAAASDLKFALDELAAAFRKVHPDVAITPTYGSSGNFYAQLSNDAPFDLFLSADVNYPQKLIDQGKGEPGSLFRYAQGRIVVWVRNDSPLDLQRSNLSALASAKTIAIANPKHAPYGRAAEAALRHAGLYDRVKGRLVLAENVAQAAQFVESGAADAGIVALSLAVAPPMRGKGRYAEIDPAAHPPSEQGGVVLKGAKDPAAARDFRTFLLSSEARVILKTYGFGEAAQ